MAMIKDRTRADREVLPKLVQIGEPVFIKLGDKWVRKDNHEIEAISMTLGELTEYLKLRKE